MKVTEMTQNRLRADSSKVGALSHAVLTNTNMAAKFKQQVDRG